jgi:ribosomal protein L7Ae-like RNA K-turn-binding protein
MPGRADPLALLGLARRAGKVLQGTDAVRRAVRSGEAALVLLAGDASPVQLEKVRRLLRHHEVPHAVVADRNRLGPPSGRVPCRRWR